MQEANYPIRDRRRTSVLAAERDSSAAAEYTLELEVCTDVPAHKQFFLVYTGTFSPGPFICMCLHLGFSFFYC